MARVSVVVPVFNEGARIVGFPGPGVRGYHPAL